MKKYLAQTAFSSSSNKVKYSMFIGRWQPWHEGHQWLIDQALKEDKRVLLCIRDVEVDDRNPFPAEHIRVELSRKLSTYILEDKVKLMIIPDIESINIGRDVGYDIIEHLPPEDIKNISATKIREQIKIQKNLI